MINHSRPVNVNDPLPRPLQEICFLPLDENMAFWRLVLRESDFKQMRAQSYTLYRNMGDRHVTGS